MSFSTLHKVILNKFVYAGSGFGSAVKKLLNPHKEEQLDPDPHKMNEDPQPWFFRIWGTQIFLISTLHHVMQFYQHIRHHCCHNDIPFIFKTVWKWFFIWALAMSQGCGSWFIFCGSRSWFSCSSQCRSGSSCFCNSNQDSAAFFTADPDPAFAIL